MEQEKKKRWRPSLTAYRELERKLEEQIEGTSAIVADCDGWREKYRDLKERYDNDSQCQEYASLEERYQNQLLAGERSAQEIDSLKAEMSQLQRSNKLMEDELKRQKGMCQDLAEKERLSSIKIAYLRSRGLWARIINKE